MLRFVAMLAVLAIAVYALIDIAQSDGRALRTLPKPVWMIVVLVFPLVGAIAWFVAGRPGAPVQPPRSVGGTMYGGPADAGGRPRPPIGPDDDEDFLRRI